MKRFILVGVALSLAGSVMAQRTRTIRTGDSTIRNTTLDVYQVYKPELKPYVRPELQPSLPPAPASDPETTFTVPQQTLYYTYRSLPLRPLALGKDTTHPPKQNYVKVGGGNLSTFIGEAGIGNIQGDNWKVSALGHFLTQEGDIQGQRYLHTGLLADGSYTANRYIFNAGIEADYRRYSLYGYNHDAYHYTNEDLRRPYTHLLVRAGLRNTEPGPWGINYAPSVAVSMLYARTIDAERSININIPFSKAIDSNISLGLDFSGAFSQLSPGSSGYPSNNVFSISPYLTIASNEVTAHFGLSPTFGKGGNSYLLPTLNFRYRFRDVPFAVSGGWDASLIQNTYRQLSLKNPFLLNPSPAEQTRQDEVFVGLEGGIGTHLSFSGRGSWWQWQHLPLFINYWPGIDGKDFDVIYDPRVTALSLQGSAKYQFAESFSIGVSGTWYAYTQKSFEHVWGEPSVRMRADLHWHPIRELSLNAYTTVLDGIYAKDADGNSVKLKATLDIGGGAEYNIIKQLSLFANISNLLNNRNERWMGYPSFGTNIWGGLRFSF